jgi:predicted ATPase/DNA-binding CsgD family transcriptional regulator
VTARLRSMAGNNARSIDSNPLERSSTVTPVPRASLVQRVSAAAQCTCQAQLLPLPGCKQDLPEELSSLVGRAEEIDAVAAGLRTARLVTLTGVGGVGKTRLALRVAKEVSSEYADAAWAALGSVAQGDQVGHVVATALGLHDGTNGSPVRLPRERRLLLVLDNCEHLIAECAELVTALLQNYPGVHVLATSREPLGVPGELAYPVAPLALPQPDESFERQIESEAVRLLVERVRAHVPEFQVTPQTCELALRICHSLGGIPLAIELAAARTPTMTLAEIALRLDDQLALLTGGGRGTPVRHKTVRASLDWSFELLQDTEQRLLRRLSVFTDGWTLDTAEAVCAADDLSALDVSCLLDRLVAQSLVQAKEQSGRTIFSAFDAVRQFASERLEQAGELASTQQRYRDWCHGLVHQPAVEPPSAEDEAIESAERGLEAGPTSTDTGPWQDVEMGPLAAVHSSPVAPILSVIPHARPQYGSSHVVARPVTTGPERLAIAVSERWVGTPPTERRDLRDQMHELVQRIPRRRRSTDLSEREWDVALRVARGLSNREIADEIVVNKKTAEAHVSHILTKLGLRSRVQLATWIVQHGLDQLENNPAALSLACLVPRS